MMFARQVMTEQEYADALRQWAATPTVIRCADGTYRFGEPSAEMLAAAINVMNVESGEL